MINWILENDQVKTIHLVNSPKKDVAVATAHTTKHCVASTCIPPIGEMNIIIRLTGLELNGDTVIIGIANEKFQERNNFDATIGSTDDSWGLSSGKFIHNGKTQTGYPTFDPNINTFEITINHDKHQANFVLNGLNVRTIDIAQKQYQILISMVNGSATILENPKVPVWCPRDLNFEDIKIENNQIPLELIKARHEKLLNMVHSTKQDRSAYTVMLIGEPGVGKSSFLNTILTATSLDRDERSDPVSKAAVRSTDLNIQPDEDKRDGPDDGLSCTTRCIIQYKIPNSSVRIRDIPGIKSKGDLRYVDDWSKLLKGQYTPGFCKDKPVTDQMSYFKQEKDLKSEDRVDCIVIFLSATEVNFGNDIGFDTAREIIKATRSISNDGIPYLIVLTKIDEIGRNQVIKGIKEENFNIQHVYYNYAVYQKALVIKKKLGCDFSQIIPVQNYSSSDLQGLVQLSYYHELYPLRVLTRGITLIRDNLNSFDDTQDDITPG